MTARPLPLHMCHNCGTTDARQWVNLGGGRWACASCWWPTGSPT